MGLELQKEQLFFKATFEWSLLQPSKGRLKNDFSKNQNQRKWNIPCSVVILK